MLESKSSRITNDLSSDMVWLAGVRRSDAVSSSGPQLLQQVLQDMSNETAIQEEFSSSKVEVGA